VINKKRESCAELCIKQHHNLQITQLQFEGATMSPVSAKGITLYQNTKTLKNILNGLKSFLFNNKNFLIWNVGCIGIK
jgi:hypothetical protein